MRKRTELMFQVANLIFILILSLVTSGLCRTGGTCSFIFGFNLRGVAYEGNGLRVVYWG